MAHAEADVESRVATIFSEGTRIHADVYHLKALAGKSLPTLIMAHGRGGTAALLRTQATDFANAGYFVIAFDYRGWGNSESRVLLTQPPRGRQIFFANSVNTLIFATPHSPRLPRPNPANGARGLNSLSRSAGEGWGEGGSSSSTQVRHSCESMSLFFRQMDSRFRGNEGLALGHKMVAET